MFELSISAKNCKPFIMELDNELEFYETIYHISKQIKGVADYTLRFCGEVVKIGSIGKPPRNVFNPINGKWYDFEFFKRNIYDFPLTTRLQYWQYLPFEKEQLYGFL